MMRRRIVNVGANGRRASYDGRMSTTTTTKTKTRTWAVRGWMGRQVVVTTTASTLKEAKAEARAAAWATGELLAGRTFLTLLA